MSGGDRDLICAIRWPLTLMTVGVLFALNNFTPYKFWQTWPVLLIVFGLLSLAGRGAARMPPPAQPQAAPPVAGPPWIQHPPAPPAGYRQSSYPAAGSPPPGGAPRPADAGSRPPDISSRPPDAGGSK